MQKDEYQRFVWFTLDPDPKFCHDTRAENEFDKKYMHGKHPKNLTFFSTIIFHFPL